MSAADFNRIVSIGIDEHEPELPRLDEPGDACGQMKLKRRSCSSRSATGLCNSRRGSFEIGCFAGSFFTPMTNDPPSEVDAAHIGPVEASGPDILSNGIALSGTAHWMFDRGLIGLSDDLDILISRQANDPDSIQGLLNKTGKATVPSMGLRAATSPVPEMAP